MGTALQTAQRHFEEINEKRPSWRIPKNKTPATRLKPYWPMALRHRHHKAYPASGSATGHGKRDGGVGSTPPDSTAVSTTISVGGMVLQPVRNSLPERAEETTMTANEWDHETTLELAVRLGLVPETALPESWRRHPPRREGEQAP